MPKKQVLAFRKDILQLFRALANHKLLAGSIKAMEYSRKTMQAHLNLFSKEELAGLELGMSMLRDGYALFSSMNEKEITLVLKGIEWIEIRWYEDILRSTK